MAYVFTSTETSQLNTLSQPATPTASAINLHQLLITSRVPVHFPTFNFTDTASQNAIATASVFTSTETSQLNTLSQPATPTASAINLNQLLITSLPDHFPTFNFTDTASQNAIATSSVFTSTETSHLNTLSQPATPTASAINLNQLLITSVPFYFPTFNFTDTASQNAIASASVFTSTETSQPATPTASAINLNQLLITSRVPVYFPTSNFTDTASQNAIATAYVFTSTETSQLNTLSQPAIPTASAINLNQLLITSRVPVHFPTSNFTDTASQNAIAMAYVFTSTETSQLNTLSQPATPTASAINLNQLLITSVPVHFPTFNFTDTTSQNAIATASVFTSTQTSQLNTLSQPATPTASPINLNQLLITSRVPVQFPTFNFTDTASQNATATASVFTSTKTSQLNTLSQPATPTASGINLKKLLITLVPVYFPTFNFTDTASQNVIATASVFTSTETSQLNTLSQPATPTASAINLNQLPITSRVPIHFPTSNFTDTASQNAIATAYVFTSTETSQLNTLSQPATPTASAINLHQLLITSRVPVHFPTFNFTDTASQNAIATASVFTSTETSQLNTLSQPATPTASAINLNQLLITSRVPVQFPTFNFTDTASQNATATASVFTSTKTSQLNTLSQPATPTASGINLKKLLITSVPVYFPTFNFTDTASQNAIATASVFTSTETSQLNTLSQPATPTASAINLNQLLITSRVPVHFPTFNFTDTGSQNATATASVFTSTETSQLNTLSQPATPTASAINLHQLLITLRVPVHFPTFNFTDTASQNAIATASVFTSTETSQLNTLSQPATPTASAINLNQLLITSVPVHFPTFNFTDTASQNAIATASVFTSTETSQLNTLSQPATPTAFAINLNQLLITSRVPVQFPTFNFTDTASQNATATASVFTSTKTSQLNTLSQPATPTASGINLNQLHFTSVPVYFPTFNFTDTASQNAIATASVFTSTETSQLNTLSQPATPTASAINLNQLLITSRVPVHFPTFNFTDTASQNATATASVFTSTETSQLNTLSQAATPSASAINLNQLLTTSVSVQFPTFNFTGTASQNATATASVFTSTETSQLNTLSRNATPSVSVINSNQLLTTSVSVQFPTFNFTDTASQNTTATASVLTSKETSQLNSLSQPATPLASVINSNQLLTSLVPVQFPTFNFTDNSAAQNMTSRASAFTSSEISQTLVNLKSLSQALTSLTSEINSSFKPLPSSTAKVVISSSIFQPQPSTTQRPVTPIKGRLNRNILEGKLEQRQSLDRPLQLLSEMKTLPISVPYLHRKK
ncbi:uncharacterized protein [Montipora capricornis]|uniref:uncharacterized protein n=1 Tax=Montipora capricornis TaxID=246305 RepID=UPI0035F1A0DA